MQLFVSKLFVIFLFFLFPGPDQGGNKAILASVETELFSYYIVKRF